VDYNDFRLINLEGLVILEVYFGVFMQFIFLIFFSYITPQLSLNQKGLQEEKRRRQKDRGEEKQRRWQRIRKGFTSQQSHPINHATHVLSL
jgi:hypothetical protein